MPDKKISRSHSRKTRPVRPVEEMVITDPSSLPRLQQSVVIAAVNRLNKLGLLAGGLYKTDKGEQLKRDINQFNLERSVGEQRPQIPNLYYQDPT